MYYRRWALIYRKPMVILIDRILRNVKHEEQVYNSCKGILHMCHDVPRLIACIDASACKYSYFKKKYLTVLCQVMVRPGVQMIFLKNIPLI